MSYDHHLHYLLHPWRELQWESPLKDGRASVVLVMPPGLKIRKRQGFHIDTGAGVVTAPAGFRFSATQPYREFEWQAAQDAPGFHAKLGLAILTSDPLDRFHQELIDQAQTGLPPH